MPDEPVRTSCHKGWPVLRGVAVVAALLIALTLVLSGATSSTNEHQPSVNKTVRLGATAGFHEWEWINDTLDDIPGDSPVKVLLDGEHSPPIHPVADAIKQTMHIGFGLIGCSMGVVCMAGWGLGWGAAAAPVPEAATHAQRVANVLRHAGRTVAAVAVLMLSPRDGEGNRSWKVALLKLLCWGVGIGLHMAAASLILRAVTNDEVHAVLREILEDDGAASMIMPNITFRLREERQPDSLLTRELVKRILSLVQDTPATDAEASHFMAVHGLLTIVTAILLTILLSALYFCMPTCRSVEVYHMCPKQQTAAGQTQKDAEKGEKAGKEEEGKVEKEEEGKVEKGEEGRVEKGEEEEVQIQKVETPKIQIHRSERQIDLTRLLVDEKDKTPSQLEQHHTDVCKQFEMEQQECDQEVAGLSMEKWDGH